VDSYYRKILDYFSTNRQTVIPTTVILGYNI